MELSPEHKLISLQTIDYIKRCIAMNVIMPQQVEKAENE